MAKTWLKGNETFTLSKGFLLIINWRNIQCTFVYLLQVASALTQQNQSANHQTMTFLLCCNFKHLDIYNLDVLRGEVSGETSARIKIVNLMCTIADFCWYLDNGRFADTTSNVKWNQYNIPHPAIYNMIIFGKVPLNRNCRWVWN